MNKVYVLIEKKRMPVDRSPESGKEYEDVVGVITDSKLAKRFEKKHERGYLEFELNNLELLNDIDRITIGEK